MKIKVGIVGAQGYAGRELARILNQHPHAQLSHVFTTQKDWELSYDLPEISDHTIAHYDVCDIMGQCKNLDVLFLATPPDVSMTLVAELIESPIILIDLSGAFRLSAEEFNATYGLPAPLEPLLKKAIYGLSPWWTPQCASQSHWLIANPGCYATCALITLLPLLKAKVIQSESLIIDAKSGVTGAGRQPSRDRLFCEVSDTFFPYKIEGHPHIPEMHRHIEHLIGRSSNITMMTHLLPLKRGISMTLYARPIHEDISDDRLQEAISNAYQMDYAHYPLIKWGSLNEKQGLEKMSLLSLKHVVGSPRTHIGYFIKNRQIFIFSCIDNLLKGAASQAVENFNLIFDLPCETGLLQLEGVL